MDGAVIDVPVTVSYEFTKAEYLSAARACFRQARAWQVIVGIGVGMTLLGILAGADGGGWLGTGISLLAWPALCYLISSAWRWRSEPLLRGTQHYGIGEDGVWCKTAISEATLSWPFYKRLVEYDDFYLLFAGRRGGSPILKRAFASSADEARFRDIVKRHVPAKLR